MMIPKDVTVPSMQQSGQLTETNFSTGQSGIIACLSSPLPESELEYTMPALTSWHLPEFLVNCLPKRFSHAGNLNDPCVLVPPLIPIIRR